MLGHVVLLCIAAAAVVSETPAECPERCQCLAENSGYRNAVGCARQHTSTIPAEFPPDTEYIKFEGNNLAELTRDLTFPALPKLRRLDLYRCTLRKIGADAFRNTPALEVLYLNDNAIHTIEAGAFRGLSALRLLDLRGNNLAELSDSVFSGLNLEYLRLAGNGMTTIGNVTFKGATVGTLELSDNAIGMLPANALFPLRSSLKTLLWKNNARQLNIASAAFNGVQLLDELSLVNSRLYDDLSFLQYVKAKILDLSSNWLKPGSLNLAKYASMESVRELRMRNMSLTAISSQLLPKSRSLRDIVLTGNNLTVASGDSFKWVTGMQKLELGENLLTRLPEGLAEVAPGLRLLRISWNRITSLDAKTLAPFVANRLGTLDVSSNRIQTFDESLRPLLTNISSFIASNNPLHCNCELQWYRKWLMGPGMSELGLSDTCAWPVSEYALNINYMAESELKCTAPRIVTVPPTKLVDEGDEVFLTCSAVADPAPEVEWTAPSGDAISITPSQDRARNRTIAVWRLSVAITAQQAGNYTCTASNLKGNVSATVCVGVRTPGSTRTVCDVTAPVTPGSSRAPTTVSRTSATSPATTVTTTRDDVIASSHTSSTPTGVETTVAQSSVTAEQPRVTSNGNSRDASTTALEEIATDAATTHRTEDTAVPDIVNPPGQSVNNVPSSNGWVNIVVPCVVALVIVVFCVVVGLYYFRRKCFSRSTTFSPRPDDKAIGNSKIKLVDSEIALIPQSPADDKPEKDAMLLAGETGNGVDKAGQGETTVEMTKRNGEGYSGPSQSNPGFVLNPGSYSTETSVDETCKDDKAQSSKDNSEQHNVEKRNKPPHSFTRSYSANPEGGTSLSTGRLSRGETEA